MNSLKVALRTLTKNKFYSIISILGLAFGIAFCLLMALYLKNEYSYDRYHDKSDNIYRLVFDNYQNLEAYASTPLPLGPALKEDFAEIEAMTRITYAFNSLVRFNNNRFFERMSFVDTGLVDVLKLEFIHGDPKTALSQPNQIILSQSTAFKYFGDDNPVGKILEIGNSGSLNSKVTGVFRDFPQNSHLHLDIGLPFSTYSKVFGEPDLWMQMPRNYTYFRLMDGQSPHDFVAKLPAFAQRHVGIDIEDYLQSYILNIQPISSIHLHSNLQNETERGANISNLNLLGSIAILVLIIAWINYINYTSAMFTRRAKEVGVRKVIGANRKQLIGQYLSESFLLAVVAGITALFLSKLFLPFFNDISGKYFSEIDLNQIFIYASLSLLILIITFGAGIFPAIYLSGFNASEVLKGKQTTPAAPAFARKYLMTLQFTVSVILLVATIVIYSQMRYARDQFQPDSEDKVVLFQINSTIDQKFDVLKEELLKHPGIISISAGSNIPTFYGDSWPLRTDLNTAPVQTENYTIENDFIETLGYELIAGRDLDKNRSSDNNSGFILNESAVKSLGFSNPENALGQSLQWGSENKKKGDIVGVVRDFHFQSLREEVQPALIQFSPFDWMVNNYLVLKIKTDHFQDIQTAIREAVLSIDPKWVADIKYLDDNFDQLHQKDIQQGRLFGAFSLFAILISCLGLLGLTAFAADRRTKEIGIRKILGARVSDIIILISREFIILILIALIIAIPVAWLLMNSWLSNFVYRINMQWWIFVLAGITVIVLALLTIGLQSVKAALSNPVESLRNE